MRSWLRILENGSARLFGAAVQVLVLSVTARQLGPAGQGLLVTATTWTALFASFAGLSLGQVSHQRITGASRDERLPSLAGTMLALGLTSSSLAYGLMLTLALAGHGVFRDIPLLVLALACLPLALIVLEEYGRNLLAAAGLSRSYAVAQVAGSTARLVLVAAAAGPLELGILGVLGGLAIGQAVTVALEAHAIFTAAGKRVRPNLMEARRLLRGALRLHANTLATFLLAQGNILLLNQFAGQQDVGFYQLSLQFIMALLLLPQAASMLLFEKVAELGPDAAWPYQRRLALQLLLVVSAIAALAGLIAPLIISMVAGPEFASAVPIFRQLTLVFIAGSLAELMAPQWYARGAFLLSSILTCLCAAASLALNWFLIRKFGVMGAVYGTVACHLVFVVLAQLAFALWCESRYRASMRSGHVERAVAGVAQK